MCYYVEMSCRMLINENMFKNFLKDSGDQRDEFMTELNKIYPSNCTIFRGKTVCADICGLFNQGPVGRVSHSKEGFVGWLLVLRPIVSLVT